MDARALATVVATVTLIGYGEAAAQQLLLFNPVRTQSATDESPLNQHVVIGENSEITTDFLTRHHRQSNGGPFGDNAVVADFWYDATHRRIASRSIQLFDVEDPADIRLGRAPGRFPNILDFHGELQQGTIVGHMGFVGWSQNGFGAYQTAVQGAVIDRTRGMLFLSAAPGVPGRTRAGSRYEGNELVQHVALMPNGSVVFGYNTDPAQIPGPLVTVRGDLHVEGVVYARKCIEVPDPATVEPGGPVP